MHLPDFKVARSSTKIDYKKIDYKIDSKYLNKYKGKKCFLKTYGCQMNEHDSENIKGILELLGFSFTEDIEEADLVLLNTCSIRENAHNKAFGLLGKAKHIKESKRDLMIGLCGCMAQEEIVVNTIMSKYPFVNFVIGTHRILSDDVIFKDLGLLVIDEEQRFGVKHKEKIKKYKNNIDVLTLSATPIPRTLQMSIAGIRSLSLIETPPIDRYPIQTYVLAENKQIIKDAIYKELARNGQIFVLYNRVENIENEKNELQKLVPEAKIGIAHGQMNKNELEQVMIDFTDKKYDILLCTTIIETGIDIESANTLIIKDADHFGLSQLYQIRGRIGRSNKIAYCYLMYAPNKILTEVATKRLKVIKDFTELGSGFAIAMRDLSIRGAGDILGSQQAGFIDSIGIELFMQMLNEEIDKLKGIKPKEEESKDKMPLIDVSTAINDNFVSDEELKIEIHKKISSIDSYQSLNKIKHELEDRFGKLSEDLIIYMHEELFEKMAQEINITNIRQTKNSVEITLDKELTNKIDGETLFFETTNLSRMFRFSMKFERLVITLDIIKLDKHFIYYLIDLLKIIKKSIKK